MIQGDVEGQTGTGRLRAEYMTQFTKYVNRGKYKDLEEFLSRNGETRRAATGRRG